MKRVITMILTIMIAICYVPSVAFANVNYEGDCEINSNVYKIPNEAGTYTYYFTPETDGVYAIYWSGRLQNRLTYKIYEERNGSFISLDAVGQNTGGEDFAYKTYKTADCNYYVYKANRRYKLVTTCDGSNALSDFQIRRLSAKHDVKVMATEGGLISRWLYLETDDDESLPLDMHQELKGLENRLVLT